MNKQKNSLGSLLRTTPKPSSPDFGTTSPSRLSPIGSPQNGRNQKHNLSIKSPTAEQPKYFAKSFYTAKTAKAGTRTQSQESTSYGKGFSQHSEAIIKGITPIKQRKSIKGITYVEANAKQGKMPPLKTFATTESTVFESIDYGSPIVGMSRNQTPLYTTQSSMNTDYLKQARFVKNNSHMQKFSFSKGLLDKRDSGKLFLSKEAFYYPDQLELLHKVSQQIKVEESVDTATRGKFLKKYKKLKSE